jgi:hypothetical protein
VELNFPAAGKLESRTRSLGFPHPAVVDNRSPQTGTPIQGRRTRETKFPDTYPKIPCSAEHMREPLLLNSSQPFLHVALIPDFLHVTLAHMVDGASEESASAAGRI